jgi:DNA-binding response OmpR family regulator
LEWIDSCKPNQTATAASLVSLFLVSLLLLMVVSEVTTMSTALIVEDSLTDLQILVRCLQEGGINVLIAQSGEEAIATITKQKPDVVVLDVVLPGCSGFEVCRRLKAEADTSHIPVVICSTKGSQMDRFWGLKQGADAYLAKPVDQDELVHTIRQLINR